MNKLRVGVVGIGYLGNYHAEKYAKMKDVELVGVVDVDKKRAEAAGKKFSTTPYFDHQDLSGTRSSAEPGWQLRPGVRCPW